MPWGILIDSSKNDGRTSDRALAKSLLKASPCALQSTLQPWRTRVFPRDSKLSDCWSSAHSCACSHCLDKGRPREQRQQCSVSSSQATSEWPERLSTSEALLDLHCRSRCLLFQFWITEGEKELFYSNLSYNFPVVSPIPLLLPTQTPSRALVLPLHMPGMVNGQVKTGTWQ